MAAKQQKGREEHAGVEGCMGLRTYKRSAQKRALTWRQFGRDDGTPKLAEPWRLRRQGLRWPTPPHWPIPEMRCFPRTLLPLRFKVIALKWPDITTVKLL